MNLSDDLKALETARCEAIARGDVDTLKEMLTEDYIHVYGGGLTSGRDGWIDHIEEVPRAPTRGELTVRLYGDTAVLTGVLINRIRPRQDAGPSAQIGERVPIKEDVRAFATQVAVRQAGTWRFCSFQMTRCTD